MAAAIVERAGEHNDPVVVLSEQRASLATAIMGALKARRCYVPLDPLFPERRLARTIERSGAGVILATRETRDLAARLARPGLGIIDVDRPGAAAGGTWARPGPDDLATIYYTSGSTGEPKGVFDSHRNVLHNVLRYTNTLGFGPADRLTLLQRPAFSGAVSSLFGAILNGATSCIFDLPGEGPAALRRWLATEQITVYHSVPSIFREIASEAAAFEAMRVVRLEGDRATRIDLELFDRYFRGRSVLVNGLGATECGIVRQFVFRASDPIPDTVPLGHPVEDMEVMVVDRDGDEVATGEAGEILVRSRFLAQGYWHDPELTEQRFSGETDGIRSYRTGDWGRLDADGSLYHLGRVDFRPRFRGQQVEVEAIERTLVGANLARQVAVRMHERPGGGPLLVAYVVPPAGVRPTRKQLRTALERDVPASSVPSHFLLLEELPLGENEKVDIGALPVPGAGRPELDAPTVDPRSALEALLASVWADVLGLDRVGVLDEFRDLGGDSLSAAQILSDVGAQLRVDLAPAVMLQAPTIAELARTIERTVLGDAPPAVLRLQEGTAAPVVFATGDILGGGLYCRRLAHQLGPERPFFAVSPFDPQREPTPATIEEMAQERLLALREHLPAGRCIVAGFCGPGGVLAYELAHQLEQEGSQVILLVLIDTFPISPRLRGEGRPFPVGITIRAFDRALRVVPSLRRRVVASIVEREVRALPRADAFAAHFSAAAVYEPEPIQAPICVLWPTDEPQHPSLDEFRGGWAALSPSVEVTPVPGDHSTTLTLETDWLAAAMLEAITSAGDKPAGEASEHSPAAGAEGVLSARGGHPG